MSIVIGMISSAIAQLGIYRRYRTDFASSIAPISFFCRPGGTLLFQQLWKLLYHADNSMTRLYSNSVLWITNRLLRSKNTLTFYIVHCTLVKVDRRMRWQYRVTTLLQHYTVAFVLVHDSCSKYRKKMVNYCGLPSVWSLSDHNKGLENGGAQLMPIRPFPLRAGMDH